MEDGWRIGGLGGGGQTAINCSRGMCLDAWVLAGWWLASMQAQQEQTGWGAGGGGAVTRP